MAECPPGEVGTGRERVRKQGRVPSACKTADFFRQAGQARAA